MEYKDTLNLPNTTFPMKANLPVKEAELLRHWEEIDIYNQIRSKAKGRPKYILHDGPPYANGNIHMGTALNKILKDIVIKIKNMDGFDAPYIPGWDCHGLPIEHQVDKQLGEKKATLKKDEIRKRCREYAAKYIEIQRQEFKRLGVFADWENPYLTMNYSYEADIIREVGRFIEIKGIYKGLKPVHWCKYCNTALAEAEVEYSDHTSPSIFVKFPLIHADIEAKFPEVKNRQAYIVIWTTTPWTLPANLAVCLHPDLMYGLMDIGDSLLIMAEGLINQVAEYIGIKRYKILATYKGSELEYIKYRHPFMEKTLPIILGSHVTLEQGTGCVHTAPAHGQEDFDIGNKYNLGIFNPVDDKGRFTNDVPMLAGIDVISANAMIIELLKKDNLLLKDSKISHSYPHCWRCKRPIIFRATSQWFISMSANKIREVAIEEIDKVEWVPHGGKERILNMVIERPDWCISRQRAWGVPIPVLYCTSCKEPLFSKEVVAKVASLVEERGADVWFQLEPKDFLPKGGKEISCKQCGNNTFEKETDILDVWFDSGVSHSAVLKRSSQLTWPADLYLEGTDQHRGWFQSSLLTAVALDKTAPYRSVLTHGYVVDGEGKKMAKSIGNIIPPQKIIEQYGAEIIRLWVASENYREDIRISDEILKRLAEAYRKIRNTFRFILGNLYDFDPNRDKVLLEDLMDIDRYILLKLHDLIKRITTAFNNFEFHIFFHSFQNFCIVDLSAFYLDIIKDRLYTYKKDSIKRRAGQTTIYEIASVLVRLMSPILSFTADEIWDYMPREDGMPASVHLASLPQPNNNYISNKLAEEWNSILEIRGEVTKALETARRDGSIGHSLDSLVLLKVPEGLKDIVYKRMEDMAAIFIVSEVRLLDEDETDSSFINSIIIDGLKLKILAADGKKCERCWIYSVTVGTIPEHPNICKRCHENII